MYQPSRGVICLLCNRSVLRRRRITLTRILFDRHPGLSQRFEGRQMLFNNTEQLCRPCFQSITHNEMRDQQDNVRQDQSGQVDHADQLQEHNNEQQDQEIEQPDNVNQPQDPNAVHPNLEGGPFIQEADGQPHSTYINLPRFLRPPNTANACIFYQCRLQTRLRIPERIKNRLLMDFNYYIPESARVCQFHFQSENWEDLPRAPNSTHSFNAEQVEEIIINTKKCTESRVRLDFENLDQIHEDELYFWTGRTRQEFLTVFNETPSLNSINKPKTALAIFLAKLTTGESNERLARVFQLSRRQLERYMKESRDALTQDYVPRHLGWDHISREEVLQRNKMIPIALFGNPDKMIVICDGTYVYIYKSSNFLFQIKTYSPHKFLNLLKPFLIVCTDGYIIEVTGPHAAKQSDASIVQKMLNDEEHPFHCFFDHGDKFILDRGFRDVVPDLEAFGYEAFMPETLNRGERQLTTSQANDSRMVTMCRWVVEVVNGRFKRDYRLFRYEYFHSAMPHMFQDFRIGAALINGFHVPIEDSQFAPLFLQRIEARIQTENVLAEYVERHGLNPFGRRHQSDFQNINADLPGLQSFPSLTEQQLVTFALGTYQLKLAKSYYSEHIRNGVYMIQVFQDNGQLIEDLNEAGIHGNDLWLLRGKIQSRYARTRTYYSYLVVNTNETGLDAINYYYCSCKAGKRTLGCCAHIMVIVWFLGLARHQESIHRPAEFLDSVIIDV